MTIFISLGHNNAFNWIRGEHGEWRPSVYRDLGAVSGTEKEYEITKEIARLLPGRYKGNNTLIFVPEKLNLSDRCKWINKKAIDGDVCIELHMNKGGGNGTEVFYYAGSKPMMGIASKMSNEIVSFFNKYGFAMKDRGAKPDTATSHKSLGFIRDTKPPALLIELGFIDNNIDLMAVKQYGASALASALKNVYG